MKFNAYIVGSILSYPLDIVAAPVQQGKAPCGRSSVTHAGSAKEKSPTAATASGVGTIVIGKTTRRRGVSQLARKIRQRFDPLIDDAASQFRDNVSPVEDPRDKLGWPHFRLLADEDIQSVLSKEADDVDEAKRDISPTRSVERLAPRTSIEAISSASLVSVTSSVSTTGSGKKIGRGVSCLARKIHGRSRIVIYHARPPRTDFEPPVLLEFQDIPDVSIDAGDIGFRVKRVEDAANAPVKNVLPIKSIEPAPSITGRSVISSASLILDTGSTSMRGTGKKLRRGVSRLARKLRRRSELVVDNTASETSDIESDWQVFFAGSEFLSVDDTTFSTTRRGPSQLAHRSRGAVDDDVSASGELGTFDIDGEREAESTSVISSHLTDQGVHTDNAKRTPTAQKWEVHPDKEPSGSIIAADSGVIVDNTSVIVNDLVSGTSGDALKGQPLSIDGGMSFAAPPTEKRASSPQEIDPHMDDLFNKFGVSPGASVIDDNPIVVVNKIDVVGGEFPKASNLKDHSAEGETSIADEVSSADFEVSDTVEAFVGGLRAKIEAAEETSSANAGHDFEVGEAIDLTEGKQEF